MNQQYGENLQFYFYEVDKTASPGHGSCGKFTILFSQMSPSFMNNEKILTCELKSG